MMRRLYTLICINCQPSRRLRCSSRTPGPSNPLPRKCTDYEVGPVYLSSLDEAYMADEVPKSVKLTTGLPFPSTISSFILRVVESRILLEQESTLTRSFRMRTVQKIWRATELLLKFDVML
ncbi:hypothetical protein BDR07DRAFT_1406443 [Suillus spraguei]|nr:hypothetical protein BDR07DRAFT_1406443 [Suillus spraguei]